MLQTKTKAVFFTMLALPLIFSVAACEDKNDKKTDATTVVVKKDTTAKKLDTTAVARPRQPGE